LLEAFEEFDAAIGLGLFVGILGIAHAPIVSAPSDKSTEPRHIALGLDEQRRDVAAATDEHTYPNQHRAAYRLPARLGLMHLAQSVLKLDIGVDR